MNVAIIIGTTRKDRISPRVAKWIESHATKHYPDITFKLLDLRNYELPFLEEAPWTEGRTLTDGAERWLADLKTADGYIFVTAEYNHGIPAVLKNALDYTYGEMKRKPALVYSQGVNQGARANEFLRTALNSTLGVVSVPMSGTFFGNVSQLLDEVGKPLGDNTSNDEKLTAALDEFYWYLTALTKAQEAS